MIFIKDSVCASTGGLFCVLQYLCVRTQWVWLLGLCVLRTRKCLKTVLVNLFQGFLCDELTVSRPYFEYLKDASADLLGCNLPKYILYSSKTDMVSLMP